MVRDSCAEKRDRHTTRLNDGIAATGAMACFRGYGFGDLMLWRGGMVDARAIGPAPLRRSGDVEVDPFPQTSVAGAHLLVDFPAEHPRHTLGDALLDFVFSEDVAQSFPQPFDLQARRDPLHELQWSAFDACPHLLEQSSNEAGLIHAVLDQIIPQACVILLLGERDCVADVMQLVDDKTECLRCTTLFG